MMEWIWCKQTGTQSSIRVVLIGLILSGPSASVLCLACRCPSGSALPHIGTRSHGHRGSPALLLRWPQHSASGATAHDRLSLKLDVGPPFMEAPRPSIPHFLMAAFYLLGLSISVLSNPQAHSPLGKPDCSSWWLKNLSTVYSTQQTESSVEMGNRRQGQSLASRGQGWCLPPEMGSERREWVHRKKENSFHLPFSNSSLYSTCLG